MKRTFHARKQRQLKHLAKKLHRLSHLNNVNEELVVLKNKIRFLINELKVYFSKPTIVRLLGKSALLLGVGLTSVSLNAQQLGEPQPNPFNLSQVDFDLYSLPSLGDLDNDGDLDLMFFTQVQGDEQNFQYFENIGTPESASYAEAVLNPFGLPVLAEYATFSVNATMVDIDNDGDLDVFLALINEEGPINFVGTRFYENTGSASSPAFADAVVDPFGMNPESYANHFTDLDGDGDLDIVTGLYDFDYNYQVLISFSENTGTVNDPEFVSPVLLELSHPGDHYGLNMPGSADLDNDGDMDLFIGGQTKIGSDYFGSIFYFANNGDGTFEPGVLDPFGFEPVRTT